MIQAQQAAFSAKEAEIPMIRGKAIILTFAVAALLTLPAKAKTVQEFEAMATTDQSSFIADYVHKITAEVGQKDPVLASHIKDFFYKDMPGKSISKGIWNLGIELGAIDIKARKGEADLSKIQIEGVILYVAKQEFPPQGKS